MEEGGHPSPGSQGLSWAAMHNHLAPTPLPGSFTKGNEREAACPGTASLLTPDAGQHLNCLSARLCTGGWNQVPE